MKSVLLFLFFFTTAAPAVFAEDAALLTPEEWAFVDSCAENFNTKTYAPAKASECLDKLNEKDFDLLNRLTQHSDKQAANLMARLNAIKDLDDFFRDIEDRDMQKGLVVRLERGYCVLCAMGMGPQPEKLYPWVKTYHENRLSDAEEAGLSWDSLGFFNREAVKGRPSNQTEATWALLTISDRRKFLSWQPELTVSTASAANMSNLSGKYEGVGKDFQQAYAATGGQGAVLGKTFDGAKTGGGEARASWWPYGRKGKSKYTLTDEQAAKLAPRLQQSYMGPGGELSGTKVGEELEAFSKTPAGKLKFSVENIAPRDYMNINGDFSPYTGQLRINTKLVEQAMEKHGITPAELMDESNTAALKKVSRYTAPTFVHEYGGHQMQQAWARKNGVAEYYYMDMETDAFSKQGLFVLQKQRAERKSGNTSYNSELQECHVQRARVLQKEGFAGVGRASLYYQVPSHSGEAAAGFARFEAAKKVLTERQAAAKADPAAEAARDEARPVYNKTAAFQKAYDSTYPWYKLTLKKAAEDAAYYQAELNALDKR